MSKILILSPAHPLRGGIASSSERLAYAFQEQGHDVKIISFRLLYPNFLFPGKTQYTDDPPPEGLAIDTLVNAINPFNWLAAGLKMRREKADVIVVRYWLPLIGPCLGTVLRLARRRNTKVVAITDNVIPHEKRPGDRLFTRYFIGAADAFVVMSRSVEDDIRQFTRTKPVRYAPHPIYDNYGAPVDRETALRHLGLPASDRYILFFGFIRKYKGLDLLLEAMADERVRRLGLKLVVAGEFYEDPEPYQELIRNKGLEDQVVLHPDFIPNEAVKYYFCAADLVAQTYRTATQSGISQMAYHFAVPMLVTNVGGLPEIVEHEKAGYVVPVDPAAIAGAIVDYFERDRRAEMTRAVIARQKDFSWERMVRAVLE